MFLPTWKQLHKAIKLGKEVDAELLIQINTLDQEQLAPIHLAVIFDKPTNCEKTMGK